MSVEGPITGTLPNVPHHFSTLVFRRENGVEKYYEVNYRFHGQHRSNALFNHTWQQVVRRSLSAEKAIRFRVERVLARAGVKVVRLKYMAAVHFPAKGTGKVRALRHVVGVTLEQDDFEFLLAQGMLRLLHVDEEGGTLSDKHRNVIFGLTPLQNRQAA